MRIRAVFLPLVFIISLYITACGSTNTNQAAATPQPTQTSSASTSCQTPTGQGSAYNIVSEQSEASYRVQEQFLSRDLPNDAVGKTKDITGSFLLTEAEPRTIPNLQIQVDLRTLKSDEERRDNAIRERWLESNTYPYATFRAQNVSLPANSATQEASFDMKGELTLHNTTHPETFRVTGKLSGDTINGKATSIVQMKNYSFEAPSIAGFLTAKDGATLTFDFTAKKGSCAQSVS